MTSPLGRMRIPYMVDPHDEQKFVAWVVVQVL
jgi:hypothetical protein